MIIRLGLLICFFSHLSGAQTSELDQCKQKLDELIAQTNHPVISSWMTVDREFFLLKEDMAGQSEALKLSEAFLKAPPESPESFLYSNAIQSCEELVEKFKKQLWMKAYQAVGLASVILLSGFLFFFLRIRKAPSQP